ncbi:MAG: heterodisulfide reductase subunit B [Desulfobacterales bacterium]|nr:heterodisulfide reductase subunit B [Desulfobacterales bacterium]
MSSMLGEMKDISYFPGCSLATSAKENNQSLKEVCAHIGFRLVDLEDWNCCGSSSAHSINGDLAFHLACRNLSLAPPGRPLLVACPSCSTRLRMAQHRLHTVPEAQEEYRRRWGRAVDPDLKIVHFFELIQNNGSNARQRSEALNGLKFAPYYGCMLAQPPALRHERTYHGLMEKMLGAFGAQAIPWGYQARCCGTFLSVARPDVVSPMIDTIMQGALEAGAECLVTACAMCHLNLEIRCNLKTKLPTFHFSELLAIAYQTPIQKGWFAKHLVDPMPLLKERRLVA